MRIAPNVFEYLTNGWIHRAAEEDLLSETALSAAPVQSFVRRVCRIFRPDSR